MLLYSSNQGQTPRSEGEDMKSFLESHSAELGSAQQRFADFEDAEEEGEENTSKKDDLSPATTAASPPKAKTSSKASSKDDGKKSSSKVENMNSPPTSANSEKSRTLGSATSNGSGNGKKSGGNKMSSGKAALSPQNSARAEGLLAGGSPSRKAGGSGAGADPLSGGSTYDYPAPSSSLFAAAAGSNEQTAHQHLDDQPLLSTQSFPQSAPFSPSGRRIRTYEEIEELSRDAEKQYSARISLRQAIRAMVVSDKTTAELVDFVKLCQKLDAEIRTAWIHYTTAEARGVRDPSKQEEVFLRRFFSGLQDGSMEEYRRMRNPHRGETANEVFVGGIGVIAVPAVEAYFRRFGPLRYVDVKRDKGFGFVKFENKEIMQAALAVQQHIIEGKRVEVKPAENRAPQKEISQKWSLAPREEPRIVEVGNAQSPSLLSVRRLKAEMANAEASGELGIMLPPPAGYEGKKGGLGKYAGSQYDNASGNSKGKGGKKDGSKGQGKKAGKHRDYYGTEDKYPVGSHFEHFHNRAGKIGARGVPLPSKEAKGYNYAHQDDHYTYPGGAGGAATSSYNPRGSGGSSGRKGKSSGSTGAGAAAAAINSYAGVDPFAVHQSLGGVAAAAAQSGIQIMYDRNTGQLVQVSTQPMSMQLLAAQQNAQYVGALTAMYPGTIGVAQQNAATMPHLLDQAAVMNAAALGAGHVGHAVSAPVSRKSGDKGMLGSGFVPQSAPAYAYGAEAGMLPYYDAATGSYAFVRVGAAAGAPKDDFRDSLVLPEFGDGTEYAATTPSGGKSGRASAYSPQQIQ